jgi:hypothetical protein
MPRFGLHVALVAMLIAGLLGLASGLRAQTLVSEFIAKVPAGDLAPGADSYGP